MAQCAQLHPHEDLPFFLSFIMLFMIRIRIIRRMPPVRIVPMFSYRNEIIRSHFHLSLELSSFLVRSEEHVDHDSEKSDGYDDSECVNISCEDIAELCDHECDNISESALICDGKCCPLRIVHLTLDGTHSCEAGSAEEIEYQE